MPDLLYYLGQGTSLRLSFPGCKIKMITIATSQDHCDSSGDAAGEALAHAWHTANAQEAIVAVLSGRLLRTGQISCALSPTSLTRASRGDGAVEGLDNLIGVVL